MARNEMMYRPVVNEDVLEFIRKQQKPLAGELGEIERTANANGVPIIPHETVVFLNLLLGQLKPKNILEIGAAIGFSSSLMAQHVGEDGHVTTIDRFDVMINKAKANYEKLGLTDKVTLLEGQASDILPTLGGPYDFIFMDSAKSKYYDFFPECMRLLKVGGMLIVDDVLQGGTILLPKEEIPKRSRVIHRKLNAFLDVVMKHEALESSILPLGDGLLMIVKKDNTDFSYLIE
ncbi:methyltransferase [Carnobacterium divergens]|uniref:O-methyltransferase n=1 Tax=Carnobacterium divergens TaxID=2748 RepID=UPI001071A096|nr:O-methyltransferase [Carnobacterium divergens]TFJ42804.1 methyltransferase [Carnobacterium divergens]TFJ51344.1 methyltransferase [Carnobacterium divergens]TFJ56341.1 methyltransferase [Carnobacterium divergens]TFJ63878.1 methyltransferase [Carnobacterium divergens]TFJ73036.1 methyltransferase [Carnobacterium divergens]